MLCSLRVTNSENLSHSPSLASVGSDLSWAEFTCRRMVLGAIPGLLVGGGANADLPLDPGLGKSLGFTLAADGQEGMLCSPDNHPIALGASHLGQDRAATGWRSSS